jgi:hypothetical protein
LKTGVRIAQHDNGQDGQAILTDEMVFAAARALRIERRVEMLPIKTRHMKLSRESSAARGRAVVRPDRLVRPAILTSEMPAWCFVPAIGAAKEDPIGCRLEQIVVALDEAGRLANEGAGSLECTAQADIEIDIG